MGRIFEDLRRDLQFGLRQLRGSLAFTVTAVATLALGIGANTPTFSLSDQVLLQLLPVSHPVKLVLLSERGS